MEEGVLQLYRTFLIESRTQTACRNCKRNATYYFQKCLCTGQGNTFNIP